MSNYAIGSLFALMNFLFPEIKSTFSGKGMSKGAIVCLLMLLNVNTYANVVLGGFFRVTDEVYF